MKPPALGRRSGALRAQQSERRHHPALRAGVLEGEIGQQVAWPFRGVEPHRRPISAAAARLQPEGPEIDDWGGKGFGKGHGIEG